MVSYEWRGSFRNAVAAEQARAAGCAWLHVDFEAELGPFYWASCGFRRSTAGLLALR